MGIWKIPASIPNVTSWSKRAAGAVAIMLTFLPADERTKGTCILFKKLSQSLYIPFLLSSCWQKRSHLATLNYRGSWNMQFQYRGKRMKRYWGTRKSFYHGLNLIAVESTKYCEIPWGTFLVVYWLRLCASNAGSINLISSWGTGSHMSPLKILHAATKIRSSQINKC